jgi:GDP-mannose 6-dehydrogenase
LAAIDRGVVVKISVFGLGYVGAVSAGCLAAFSHDVTGVDPANAKVDLTNRGQSPVVEKDLDRLLTDGVRNGRLRATTDARSAIEATELSLVCVGTPSKPNGDLDLAHVTAVSRQIGEALRSKNARHVVVIRSTVLPGTLRNVVIPILEEASGKKAGIDFGVGNNPEFLREGTAVADFHNPPKTVIGASDQETADTIASLYSTLDAPLIRTSIDIGEMVKYSDNVWHALKVAFANEIGSLCKAAHIDSHAVMDIFCQDTKLNLSPYYLRPGFAFGGSCLPKDVRALIYRARALDLDLPVMNAILASNARQVARGFDAIVAVGKRKVGFLGMSFKAGTDDMRESPVLELIERLLGKGFDIRIFDRNVNLAKLVGANRDYLLKTVPHVSSLLVDTPDDALAHGEVIVVGNADPEFLAIASRLGKGQHLVDLVRIEDADRLAGRYDGINW